MGREKAVGRVGALAVALGIGSAIGAMPGVAWAESDDAGSSNSAQTSTGGATGHVKSPNAESKDSGDSETGAQVKGAGDDGEKSPTKKRGSDGGKHSTPTDTSDVTTTTDDDLATKTESTHVTAGEGAKGDATDDSTPVLQPDSATSVGVTPVGTEPTTEDLPPTTPVAEPATSLTPLVSPQSSVPPGPSGTTPTKPPTTPAEPPLLWTVLVSALREFGQQKSHAGTTAAPSNSANSAKPSGSASADVTGTAITGSPEGSVIVGADGTIYQVTRNAGSTQVSVIGSDGQVLSTTPAIAGTPNVYSRAVARPDGTLVLVTTNERGTRSTISVVDGQGTVTTIGTVTGQPGSLQVASNGAVFVNTIVPTIFSPDGATDYRLVRISPTNTLRSFSRGSLTLAPDGTAYEITNPFPGVTTVLAIAADGQTRRILLPLGASVAAGPIFDQDGTAYLTAGVRQLFGGKMTRLYTFDGTSSAVRSIRGLPGEAHVTADGIYLETYTYNSFSDTGVSGTTYISRITPGEIETSDEIDGRILDFQVTSGGTVYAPLYTPLADDTVVAVVDTDGGVSTVTLPGRHVLPGVTRVTGTGLQAGENGYLSYTSGSTTYLAVLNPDGTVTRTITLPPNATTRGAVFFGPDGAAYQLVQYTNNQGQIASQSVLALSTDTYTPALSGSPFFTSPDVQFGPDGTGYLITRSSQFPGVQVLGFTAAGATGVNFVSPSAPAVRDNPSFDTAPLTFAPDGTAYIAVSGAADAGVYALTSIGASKVLDLQYSPSLSIYTVVVGVDGTVYLTTAERNSDNVSVTTVRTFAPATI